MKLSLPDLLKAATGVPSWVYLTGAAAAALGAGALWFAHEGAHKQAAKDAPAITQGIVSTSAAGLADKQITNSNQRASHEAAIDTRTSGHVSAVAAAADDRAAFDEYLRGLHDGEPALPSPVGNPRGDVRPVPGGPSPEDAPH